MKKIELAVVIATFNRPEKLKEAIKTLIKQDFPPDNWELVLVDNGSTQEYLFIEKEIKLQLPNFKFVKLSSGVGVGEARNLGAAESQADLIAFTDDDCLLPSNWLSSLVKGFSNPEVAAVGGFLEAKTDVLRSNPFARWEKLNERKYIRTMDRYFSTKRDESPFQTNNIAYRREAFLKVGGFDNRPVFFSGEDGDLKEKILKAGFKVLFIPLKVIHNQDYSLTRFISQQVNRGGGILYYHHYHHQPLPNFWLIFVRLALLPLYFLWSLLRFEFKVALVDAVGYLARNYGKIKYYGYFFQKA